MIKEKIKERKKNRDKKTEKSWKYFTIGGKKHSVIQWNWSHFKNIVEKEGQSLTFTQVVNVMKWISQLLFSRFLSLFVSVFLSFLYFFFNHFLLFLFFLFWILKWYIEWEIITYIYSWLLLSRIRWDHGKNLSQP
jgi:hypothetical protein